MCFNRGRQACGSISPRKSIGADEMSSMKEKERAQTQVSTSIAVQDASQSRLHRYVLMTSAYNEEATIARVIESVLAQTLRPELWVVVSDGSSDGTDEIIQK